MKILERIDRPRARHASSWNLRMVFAGLAPRRSAWRLWWCRRPVLCERLSLQLCEPQSAASARRRFRHVQCAARGSIGACGSARRALRSRTAGPAGVEDGATRHDGRCFADFFSVTVRPVRAPVMARSLKHIRARRERTRSRSGLKRESCSLLQTLQVCTTAAHGDVEHQRRR